MARIRKSQDPGPIAVALRAKKRRPGADTGVVNGKPPPVQRVTEFPKSPAADDVVSDRIIFEIGASRFAIHWTAEIERLPPAGPVGRTEAAAESGAFASKAFTFCEQKMTPARFSLPVM